MPEEPVRTASPREVEAAREFIRRVRGGVSARLVQASLFGSKARGEARPGSDVDVLLVFERLPWDREPQASMAEEIAERCARQHAVPITAWSVALVDLAEGRRTPMLVDALADAVPLWAFADPLDPVPFTPRDALHCVAALLTRVEEGSREFAARLELGDLSGALRRGRDDLVRLCTAWLLLHGVTRPRRAEAVYAFMASAPGGCAGVGLVLGWAANSFGRSGRDEGAPPAPPPGGIPALGRSIGDLRGRVLAARDALGRAEAARSRSR